MKQTLKIVSFWCKPGVASPNWSRATIWKNSKKNMNFWQGRSDGVSRSGRSRVSNAYRPTAKGGPPKNKIYSTARYGSAFWATLWQKLRKYIKILKWPWFSIWVLGRKNFFVGPGLATPAWRKQCFHQKSDNQKSHYIETFWILLFWSKYSILLNFGFWKPQGWPIRNAKNSHIHHLLIKFLGQLEVT